MILKNGQDLRKFRKLNDMQAKKLAQILKVPLSSITHAEQKHKERPLPIWLLGQIEDCKELDRYIPVYAEQKQTNEQKESIWQKIKRAWTRLL